MVFKHKEQVNKNFEELNEVFFFLNQKKVKLRYIESYKPRERYEADIVFLIMSEIDLKYLYNDGSFHKIWMSNSIKW